MSYICNVNCHLSDRICDQAVVLLATITRCVFVNRLLSSASFSSFAYPVQGFKSPGMPEPQYLIHIHVLIQSSFY